MAEIPQFKGIDQIEPFGGKQLVPTFKGWHQVLQRKVIIHLLPIVSAMDSIRQATLEALIHQVARHHHPGVARWLEIKETTLQNVKYYCLISEWFSDESLKDWLIKYGPLDEENAILVAEHTLTALTHFWDKCRIAHGNLKPKNILIDDKGELMIYEFGLITLQKLIVPQGLDVNIGTPTFMAPELKGGNAQPDQLSDIYALGATLSCLLTGPQNARPEVEGDEEYAQQTNMSIRVPLSLEMGEIIRQMTAEHREDRLQSWEAVRKAIKKYEQAHEIKVDRNTKTQTIKIPIWEKDVTRMIGISSGPILTPASKASEPPPLSAPAGALKSRKAKIKTPEPEPIAKEEEKKEEPLLPQTEKTETRRRTKIKTWLVPAASMVLLVIIIVMGYLRLVKGIDVFKPARNRVALAFYALFGSGDNILVNRDDLDELVSNSDKPTEPSAQQTDRLAADETKKSDMSKADVPRPAQYLASGANAHDDAPSKKTAGAETKEIEAIAAKQSPQPEAADKEKKEETQEHVQRPAPSAASLAFQSENDLKKEAEQKPAERAQGASAPQKPVAAAPAAGAENSKVTALLKRAENNDAEALCDLGDYYDSVNDKANAFEWYRRGAERKLPRALCRYGDYLMSGSGPATNEIEAVEAYKKAAEQHDAEGQYKLAMCYLKGQVVPKNPKLATQLFQNAADNNHAEAWYYLGEGAREGVGMNKNPNKAFDYYKKAAELNYWPAYCRMGDVYCAGLPGGKPNRKLAAAMYKKAAEADSIEAKCKLTMLYLSEAKDSVQDKTAQDKTEFFRWLDAAVTHPFNEASTADQQLLADIYEIYGDCLMNGTFLQKDSYKAVIWYEKAAKANNPGALYKYALCLLNGTGIQQNKAGAYSLFIQGANKDYAKAEWMLGECYMNGTGVEQNKTKAVSYFIKAAQRQVPEAQYRMGECCLNGTGGIATSMEDAFSWFLKSAETGYEPAIEEVIKCYEKGTGTKKSHQNAIKWRAKLPKSKK